MQKATLALALSVLGPGVVAIAHAQTPGMPPIPGIEEPLPARTLFLGLSIGSGAGLVSGTTEQMNEEVNDGIAPQLLYLLPEVGVYVNPALTASVALRYGTTIGANVTGHAMGDGILFGRLRYTPAVTRGITYQAAAGVGLMRHVVEIEGSEDGNPGMEMDTVAAGPLFVGGGLSYVRPMSGHVHLVFELNAYAGIATQPKFGDVAVHDTVHADAGMGLLLAL